MSDMNHKCLICGALLDEEDLFCSECGTEAPLHKADSETQAVRQSTHNFTCQGCGASMSYDATSGALRCPFCGSESMRPDNDAREIEPQLIVPFILNRETAEAALRQRLANSFWAPNDTAQQAIVSQMQPIYVPFWSFAARTETYWTADSSAVPAGARGDWVPVAGEHHGHYDKILVCCSSALTTAEMLELGDYELQQGVSPQQIDLQRVTNERFTVPRKYARPIARRNFEREELAACEQYIRGNHRRLQVNVLIEELNSIPVLLPVWIVGYRYRDSLYRFIINGQSGNSVGKIPISVPKVMTAVTVALILLGLFLAWALFH